MGTMGTGQPGVGEVFSRFSDSSRVDFLPVTLVTCVVTMHVCVIMRDSSIRRMFQPQGL